MSSRAQMHQDRHSPRQDGFSVNVSVGKHSSIIVALTRQNNCQNLWQKYGRTNIGLRLAIDISPIAILLIHAVNISYKL